jgi:hypothetical protein
MVGEVVDRIELRAYEDAAGVRRMAMTENGRVILDQPALTRMELPDLMPILRYALRRHLEGRELILSAKYCANCGRGCDCEPQRPAKFARSQGETRSMVEQRAWEAYLAKRRRGGKTSSRQGV